MSENIPDRVMKMTSLISNVVKYKFITLILICTLFVQHLKKTPKTNNTPVNFDILDIHVEDNTVRGAVFTKIMIQLFFLNLQTLKNYFFIMGGKN